MGPVNGVRALEIDVIRDRHQRPLRVGQIDAAGRIGEHDSPDAKAAQRPNAEYHLVHRVPLVEVGASAQHSQGQAVQRADMELARMPDRGGQRPTGNLGVRNRHRVIQRFGERAQSGSQYDGVPGEAA